jgi:hypothetical protein
MQRVALNSTLLPSAGYQDHLTLRELEFRDGAVYQYFHVSPRTFQAKFLLKPIRLGSQACRRPYRRAHHCSAPRVVPEAYRRQSGTAKKLTHRRRRLEHSPAGYRRGLSTAEFLPGALQWRIACESAYTFFRSLRILFIAPVAHGSLSGQCEPLFLCAVSAPPRLCGENTSSSRNPSQKTPPYSVQRTGYSALGKLKPCLLALAALR